MFFPVWSSLSGPFMSMGLHGWGGDGGQSPVVEVTAKTSLCPRPPQFITQRQLSQYTHRHTHLLIQTHTPCMYSMVRNDILTNTPKQLQHGQSPGPAGTDGVSWELTACPAAPMSHRRKHRREGAAKIGCAASKKNMEKRNHRHFSHYNNLSFPHPSVGGPHQSVL